MGICLTGVSYNMYRIVCGFVLFLCLLLAACSSSDKPLLEEHTFTDETLCAVTPALNQGRTSTCWAYATASLLESDLLRRGGDTVRLSVMYAVRQKYLNQFEAYYYSRGREEIRAGSLGHSFLRVLDEEGAMPLELYQGLLPGARWHDHRKLMRKLKALAAQAVKRRDLAGYRQQVNALLDEQLGAVPDTFLYGGVAYTPRSFADSLHLRAADYIQLTSFTHHPFYASCILELPDNWEHGAFFNLPLDELEQTVRRALADGQTVAWHGDVSEETFSVRQGMALWPVTPVTSGLRQRDFEQFATTDDHMMHLVGTARDEGGRFYYLVKNSYGKYGPYGGLLYMSEDYFRAKTISVLLPRSAALFNTGTR